MPGGSHGYRAALARRHRTPGLISSLPVTGGLPLSISFSTSYRELDSAVRRPMRRIGKRREEYFAGVSRGVDNMGALGIWSELVK
jgi:hypothetical protein